MTPERQATIFCRVSSARQADNFSHDAQERLGREYAQRLGLEVTRVFRVVETASKPDQRLRWAEYLDYVRGNPERHVLVASVDRALRNYRDLPEVQDLRVRYGKVVHFFNEGLVLDGAHQSGTDLRLGIHAAVAAWYATELREKTKRGMEQKARDGQWPTRAPFGYRCDPVTKRLVVHPEEAHWVRRIKALSAEGRWSLEQIGQMLKREGFEPYGKAARISFLHRVIRYPIYAGRFEWEGTWYEGTQELVCTWAEHEIAVAGLDREGRARSRKHTFVMAGRISCAGCGRRVVFDVKKGGRFVYARCTGVRRSAGVRVCASAEFVPLAAVEERVRELLSEIRVTEEQAAACLAVMAERAGEVEGAAEQRAALLRGQLTKLSSRMQQAYADKLDGKIDEAFWLDQHRAWSTEKVRLEEQLRAAGKAQPSRYLGRAREVVELAKDAVRAYESLSIDDKRLMLDAALSNWKLDGKNLGADFRSPFAELRYGAQTGNWWPFCDAIRTAPRTYLQA